MSRNQLCPCGSGRRYKHCCGAINNHQTSVHWKDLMSSALSLQQTGRFREAEALYRQVLGQIPDQPDCLHMLGVICYQSNRLRESFDLIYRALELTEWQFQSMRGNLRLVVADLLSSYDPSFDNDEAKAELQQILQLLHCSSEKMAVPYRAKSSVEDRALPEEAINCDYRILVVDAAMPKPDRGSGSVRLVAIMRLLIQLHCKVDFLSKNQEFVEPYGSELQRAGIEVRRQPDVWGVEHELAMQGMEYDLIFISRFDVALPYMTALRRYAPQAVFVFDTVDLHYLRMQREAAIAKRADLFSAAAIAREQELSVVRNADVTLVVSETEREILSREIQGAVIYTVANIHEVHHPTPHFDERRDIFFVGGFDHTPNLDAMRWYIQRMWPLIRKRLPFVFTHVIGSNLPETLRELGGNGINLVGYVPDLEPYLAGCRLSVAPLRYGAGVKGKINTAQSWGVPVVATSLAVEGMHLHNEQDVLIADDPDDFAEAVVRLYTNKQLWTIISEGGSANVWQHFSPEIAGKELRRLLDIVDAKRREALPSSGPVHAGKRCLMLAPAGYGSLGDEAMVRGLIAYLKRLKPDWSLDLLSIYGGNRWPLIEGVHEVITSIPLQEGAVQRAFFSRYDMFFLFGADVLDGHYSPNETMGCLRIVRLAARYGLHTTILGFSINEWLDENALEDLKALPERVTLCVRDPASFRRVGRLGIRKRTQVADVAFLMPSATGSYVTCETEMWIAKQQDSGRKVAIVNLSSQVVIEAKQNGQTFLEDFGKSVAELLSKHSLSVLLMPHDLRRGGVKAKSDVDIAMELASILKAQSAKEHYSIFIPSTADQAKRLAGLADFVITARMHLAIAALGMGTPVICLAYQDKFDGLMELFESGDFLVSPQSFDTVIFQQRCIDLMSDIEEISNRVRINLPRVMELAQANFQQIVN